MHAEVTDKPPILSPAAGGGTASTSASSTPVAVLSTGAELSSSGGAAPLLRDELSLLHSELLFERQRQELHARRNRRLRGRTFRIVAQEEQIIAMVT